jgi:hypothetical protein
MRATLPALFLVAIVGTNPSAAEEPIGMDQLAGRWSISDQTGATLGDSIIVVEAPDTMLREERAASLAWDI